MDYRRAQEELGFAIPQSQAIYNLPGIDATAKPDRDAIIRSEAATRAYQSTGIGAAAGSTLGGIAGTYFGPIGTKIGTAVGGAAGNYAEKAMFEDD
jgi:phage tail tape-measure protein